MSFYCRHQSSNEALEPNDAFELLCSTTESLFMSQIRLTHIQSTFTQSQSSTITASPQHISAFLWSPHDFRSQQWKQFTRVYSHPTSVLGLYLGLKQQFNQNKMNLLIIMSFQACMTVFLLWKTKEMFKWKTSKHEAPKKKHKKINKCQNSVNINSSSLL